MSQRIPSALRPALSLAAFACLLFIDTCPARAEQSRTHTPANPGATFEGYFAPSRRGVQAVARRDAARRELEMYRRTLERHLRTGDKAEAANVLVQMAQIYASLNEPDSAAEHYKRVLPLVADESGKKATVLGELGKIYVSQGRYEEGLHYFGQALPLWRQTEAHRFEAETHALMGQAYSSTGDSPRAFGHFKQALQLYEKLDDPEATARAYVLLGATAATHRETLFYYTQALTRWRTLDKRDEEASVLEAIASFYRGLDDRAALRYYEQALAAWEAAGDAAKQAEVLQDMGLLYSMLGDSSSARDRYGKALALWKQSGQRGGEAEASVMAGWGAYWAGDLGESLRYLSQAAALWRAEAEPTREALALAYAGFVRARMGERDAALSLLSRVSSFIATLDDRQPAKSLLSYFSGLTHILLDDRARALKDWNQELGLYLKRGDRVGAAQALHTIGWAHETAGDRQQALSFYLKSLAEREAVRAAAGVEEFKTGLAGQSADTYQRAVLLAAELGQPALAFELGERARARTLLDQLGNARINVRRGADLRLVEREQALRLEIVRLRRQLGAGRALPDAQLGAAETEALAGRLSSAEQQYGDILVQLKASNPEYASLRSVEVVRLGQLQALLDRDTTLISYFISPEKTLAFVVTRDSFRAAELCENGRCVSERELGDAVARFRGFADLSVTRPASLEQLYGWLVRPLRQHLRTRNLCVIPHGVLHYLPFGALSGEGRFLDEDFTIYHSPSASVLPLIRQKQKAAGDSLLAVAQSRVEGMPILRYGDEVARSIAGRYATQALVGPAATETAFRARASGRANLFLAAHGKLDPLSPLFSRIVLAPDAENDGLLEVHEIYDLDLAGADLVVLSACQTQLGELSRGDDIVGLNRAFLYAGAPTVVASLWSVRELQTGELMTAFFNNRKAGMTKAEALRKAQAALRSSHRHPYYWAGFVLTGEP